jgi:hypothetical protein
MIIAVLEEEIMYPHIHKYKFDCEISAGHNHRMSGHTENLIGISVFHFHYFYGISSYNNHTHYYAGITSLPIKTENGHIHRIEGIMEINDLHEHRFENYTFEDIEYISRKKRSEAFI